MGGGGGGGGGGGLFKMNILASHIHVYVTKFKKRTTLPKNFNFRRLPKTFFSVWNEALTTTAYTQLVYTGG